MFSVLFALVACSTETPAVEPAVTAPVAEVKVEETPATNTAVPAAATTEATATPAVTPAGNTTTPATTSAK